MKKCHFQQHGLGLETIILNEASQRERQKLYDVMWNLKYDATELISEPETDSGTQII